MKKCMKENCPTVYSHELINNLFKFPYTKIEYVSKDLGVYKNVANRVHETVLIEFYRGD